MLQRLPHHLRHRHAAFARAPLGPLDELRLSLDHQPLHHRCNHAISGVLPYAVMTKWPCTRLIRPEMPDGTLIYRRATQMSIVFTRGPRPRQARGAEPPGEAQRDEPGAAAGARRDAARGRRRAGHPLRRAARRRTGVLGGRRSRRARRLDRPPGHAAPVQESVPRLRQHLRRDGQAGRLPDPPHVRRRRARGGARLRPADRLQRRELRPARGQVRDHPRRRRLHPPARGRRPRAREGADHDRTD